MVGDGGQVIAIDLQPEMLEGLKQQALRDNCRNIVPHVCGAESLHAGPWKESVNFALLFWMLHEVPDAERLLREIYDLLVPGGRLLFAEPLGHVGNGGFQKSVAAFQQCGFTVVESPKIALSRARVFQKH
jgi:SAM-dependent methyltransferase